MSNYPIKTCCPSCGCKFSFSKPQSEKINLSEDNDKKLQVEEMLKRIKENDSELSKWDSEFIKSIKICIDKNNNISKKQFNKLVSISNDIDNE